MSASANENTFFTKDMYDRPNSLEIDQEILDLIYSDGVGELDQLDTAFYFHTDTEKKAITLQTYFAYICPECRNVEIHHSSDLWEVTGVWDSVKMTLAGINNWNKLLWDIGYSCDCLFEGWHIAKS